MKQIKLLLFIMILLSLSFVSAWSSNSLNNTNIVLGSCYQETANISTSCGGLNTGSYGFDLPTSTYYINYSKPLGVSNSSLWQVKHGNLPTPFNSLTENITIPLDCWNYDNKIIFKVIGSKITGISSSNKGYYYNGTGWKQLYTSDDGTCSSDTTATTFMDSFDGNWNTGSYVLDNTDVYTSAGSGGCSLLAMLWEEAMIWNITSTNFTSENLTLPKLSQDQETSYSVGGSGGITDPTNMVDEDFSTYGTMYNYQIQETFTIPYDNYYNLTLNTKIAFIYLLTNTNIYCVNQTTPFDNILLASNIGLASGLKNYNLQIPSSCVRNDGRVQELIQTTGGDASHQVFYYESRITGMGLTRYLSIPSNTILTNGYLNLSSINNATTNISLDIGNTQTFNFTGNFTSQNNKTNNLATYLNSYLSTCSYIAGYCYVPFTFHSDSAGILMYSDLIFNNNGFLENNVSYNSDVYETSNQNFLLNLTFGESNPLSVQGILNYNNTNYTSTVSCNLGNCILNNNLDVPTISSSINKSFYWIVNYYYGSNQFTINSNTFNQTINNISLYNCTSGTIALNFSAMDETTLTGISPFTFMGSFNYWLGSGNTYKTFNLNSNVSSQPICISINNTFYTNANIQYNAPGYTQKDYFLVNASLNNVTNNIILYLLDSTDSTSFIDEVLDTGRNPIVDAYIYIQRCYPGVCNTVQVIKTDSNGRSIGFYKTETVDYQHIIMKDGVVIYQDSPHKIFATSTPYTNTFYVDYGESISFNYTLPSLYESLTYDNNTNLVTYTYIDSSGLFTQGRLLVELMNYSGNNGIICNTTSTQSSATITCDMSSQAESNYEASGFITRSSETIVDIIQFTLSNAKEIFGLGGLFLGFCIILTAGMAFLYHPLAGTWMVTASMIFTNIIGFTSFTMIWIWGAIILSLIFTWFFRE